ncbi:MAG: phosphatidylglycerophosphatase A, partial [bacterium]|nr:phosphatidylglycerophosphatase A [bacterium]
LVIGTAFGLGLVPIAPGSFAALLGVLFHVLGYLFLPTAWFVPTMVALLLLTAYLNHLLTPWAETYWRKQDPGNFVLDEIAGYLMVPIFFHGASIWIAAPFGFLLFRILDIIKFPPANYFDRHVHGSWGILIDDLISGLYAVALLYLGAYLGLFPYYS